MRTFFFYKLLSRLSFYKFGFIWRYYIILYLAISVFRENRDVVRV